MDRVEIFRLPKISIEDRVQRMPIFCKQLLMIGTPAVRSSLLSCPRHQTQLFRD